MPVRRPRLRSRYLLAAAAVTLAVPPALAQQQPTPAPAPRPTRAPTIITLPGAERFDLRPSNPGASRPSPAPAPAVVPPPIPAASPTRAARPTPTPAPRPTPAARAAPAPTRQPVATATPEAAPSPATVPPALPTPAPSVPAATASAPAPASPSWLWLALGVAGAAAAGVAWRFSRKRRRKPRRKLQPPAAAPAPAPPPPVLPPRRAAQPRPAPAPPRPAEPVGFEFRPIELVLARDGIVLDYELVVGNLSDAGIEGLRVTAVLLSASPQQDELIESFHMAPTVPQIAPPFDLAARSGGRIPGKLALGHPSVHVVQVNARPMFVPLVLVDVRWRAGLSIRQHGAAFMVGTEGQGNKLGPIWLDRGPQRHANLAANRYFRKSAVQAAE